MQHILARSRGRISDLNKANAEMRAVYRRRRRVLGDRHPDTLKSRQDLAVLRGQLNDPQGAVFDLIKVLRDRLRIQGKRSIETFRTRRQLAEWIARAGHPETATCGAALPAGGPCQIRGRWTPRAGPGCGSDR